MRNFLGHKFWARGYFVTTVGRDEEVIRAYIKNQELADQQLEQFELKISAAKIQSIVQTSLKTAFGGSPIKPPALLEVIGSGGGKDPDFWSAFEEGEDQVIGDEP